MQNLQSLIPKELRAAIDSQNYKDLTTEEKKERERQYTQKQCDFYNNTPGNLNERDGYNCDLCKNKGWISKVKYDELWGHYSETLMECKCQRIRKMINRLERSGLKNIIRDYTFAKYEAVEPWQKTLKQAAENFVKDQEHSWFYIGGMTGSGKTHLCTAIAGYYLKHDKPVKYMLWRDDIVRLKANVNNAEEYSQAITELKKTPVLYIDDLFKTGKDQEGKVQMPTAADVNIAFEIINYRYNNPELITIISSERRIPDLVMIDEAVAGRIAEKTMPYGYGFNIKYDSKKNYRLKGYAEL